eukprot:293811-Chlamydomonas_euryale.AAC.9
MCTRLQPRLAQWQQNALVTAAAAAALAAAAHCTWGSSSSGRRCCPGRGRAAAVRATRAVHLAARCGASRSLRHVRRPAQLQQLLHVRLQLRVALRHRHKIVLRQEVARQQLFQAPACSRARTQKT